MLIELNIRNFAIIEDLNISFTKGLNIITGETGSGKSILIEAIGIILGSRSNRDLIQSGYDKAVLEGVFYIEKPELILPTLNEYSISLDDDNLLIINKEIFSNGPSISKVNGRNLNLSMLKNITKKLVDIFGQHEHQSLLDQSNHQIIIDQFGDKQLLELKSKIKNEYEELLEEKKKLKNLSIDNKERDREIDILKFQIQEIEDARLSKEDEFEIDNEYRKLSNVSKISDLIEQSLEYINSESFESQGIITLIDKSISLINNAKKYDENLLDLKSRIEGIAFELQDFNRELTYYIENIEIDSERLNFLYERLNLVNKLKNKYGNTVDIIINFRDESQERLNKLINLEKEVETINKNITMLENSIEIHCEELSNKRKDIAILIEKKITEELIYLNMFHVKFKVYFEKAIGFTNEGYDKIEFLISTNPGEDLKPLSRIVSGGEMSRIMLAFKSILAYFDQIPTMIFDEIDTGISGRTAQIVGEKIYNISKDHQVICISHLPQIAALGDSHFVINKVILGERTKTIVNKLSEQDRIQELARLLSGVDLTDTTLKHASEMILMSKKLKK